jgi:DNA-binding transcriptional ArsR family regulator
MQRRDDHLNHRRRDPSPSLPASLLDKLPPEKRRALIHGTRRGILRALQQDPAPRATRDLLSVFPGVTLQTISYHVLVLEECGSLTVSRIEQSPGSFARFFCSNIDCDPEILTVLRETEQLDAVR